MSIQINVVPDSQTKIGEEKYLEEIPAMINSTSEGSYIINLVQGNYHLKKSLILSNIKANSITFIGHCNKEGVCDTIIDSLVSCNDIEKANVNSKKNDLKFNAHFVVFDSHYIPVYIREQWLHADFYCIYSSPDTRKNAENDQKSIGNVRRNSNANPIMKLDILDYSGVKYYNTGKIYFRNAIDTESYSVPDIFQIGSFVCVHTRWLVFNFLVIDINDNTLKVWITSSTSDGAFLGNMNVRIRVLNNKQYVSNENNSMAYFQEKLPEFSYDAELGTDYLHGNTQTTDNTCYLKSHSFSNTTETDFKTGSLNTLLVIDECSNISFKNIAFTGNGRYDATEDFCLVQSGMPEFGAIKVWNSGKITFDTCEFSYLYGWCIRASNENTTTNLEEINIYNNYIHDTFGGGIALLENTTNNIISGNLIDGFGKYQPGTAGILIAYSTGNTIRNNTICNGYYTGISLGWYWGFPPENVESNNIVSYNKIYNCMQGVLDDGGGIYTLGDQYKTLIDHNIIHDIRSKQINDAAGIYFDEGSPSIVAQYNIIHNCSVAVHQNYGSDNTIYRNVFAFMDDCFLRVRRIYNNSDLLTKLEFKAYNNIFVLKKDSGKEVKTVRDFFIRKMLTENVENGSTGNKGYVLSDYNLVRTQEKIYNNLFYFRDDTQDSLKYNDNTPDSAYNNHRHAILFESVNLSLLWNDFFEKTFANDNLENLDGFTLKYENADEDTSDFPLNQYKDTAQNAGVVLDFLKKRKNQVKIPTINWSFLKKST